MFFVVLKTFVALAVLLLAIFLVYSFIPHSGQPLTEFQAKQFISQDLASLNADWRVISSKQESEGWSFVVLVTQNPHSVCPTTEKRFYRLPPVSFRPEPFITDCYERSKILFREEAVINSAKRLNIASGYGCAFKANADFGVEVSSYCPNADVFVLSEFAKGLPSNVWVAYWENGNTKTLMALSDDDRVLKIQAA